MPKKGTLKSNKYKRYKYLKGRSPNLSRPIYQHLYCTVAFHNMPCTVPFFVQSRDPTKCRSMPDFWLLYEQVNCVLDA